jgi:hypothetical protein
MAYTELSVLPAYTASITGVSYLVIDDTVYAAVGAGTATFPSQDQTQAWYMWQPSPFLLVNQNIPSVQDGLPVTIGTIGVDGLALPDNVNQFILMILPIGEVYADVLNDAYLSGDPWFYLIEYAQANGAVGQVAVVMSTSAGNCVYDALRRYNNAQIGGSKNCDPTEYATKRAMIQGVYSNAAVAQSLTILSTEQEDGYAASQTVLDGLNALCLLDDLKCNCDC